MHVRILPTYRCEAVQVRRRFAIFNCTVSDFEHSKTEGINMSGENNDTDGEVVSSTHENVFGIRRNTAPIIKLTRDNLTRDQIYLPNDELQQQWLTMQDIDMSHVMCVPTEIIDTNNFWVQLQNNKYELINIMINLRDFYSYYGEMYAVLPRNLCENLIVAAERNNWYFRCRILGMTQTHVKLHYVDYGKTAYAPNDKIYYLHKRFGILKAQAIHCNKFKLKPPTNKVVYPRTARVMTNRIIKDCPFVAVINEIQVETRTLKRSPRPLPQNGTPISDWLVRYGHAEFICIQSRKL